MKDLNELDIAVMDLEGVRSMYRDGLTWSQIWAAYRLICRLRPDLAAATVEFLHQPSQTDRHRLMRMGYSFGPKGMCTGWRSPYERTRHSSRGCSRHTVATRPYA